MGNLCAESIPELAENEKFKSTFSKAISSFLLNSAQINEVISKFKFIYLL